MVTIDMDTNTPEAAGPVLTVPQAAAELNCSASFVYKMMNLGEIAFERRGRRKMPLARSVAEYRQRSLVPSQAGAGEGRSATHPRRYLHLFAKEQR
jgi:excisionase family DNA binding protein